MNSVLLRQSIRTMAKANFSRSGGPGGQNVNKLNTKVTLKIRLEDLSGLNETELERVKVLLVNRINNEGEIVIASDEERSRQTNLERAYFRMENLIGAAARLPKKRRPTKPTKASIEKRLQRKKQQSRKKTERNKKGLIDYKG
jgi:ribosome-associated protein